LFFFYLAQTGGVVAVPEAHSVVDDESQPEIRVLDVAGRVLVVFRREDVSLYSRKPLSGAPVIGEP
jgi:hypothetical protein